MSLLLGAAGLLGAIAGIVALGDLHTASRPFVGLFALAAAAYALAVWRVWRRPPAGAWALAGILTLAFLVRLCLWPTEPSLSTDLYRYVWDGRLAVAGVSPYRHAPSAPELAAFRDAAVYPRLNHVDWRTVYPPGAQLLFAGLAWLAGGDALRVKWALAGFDALAAAGLLLALRAAGRPLAWVLVYAWHPLVVVELAGSGHLDGVALALSLAAVWAALRGREGWAGALVGAGALVKLYPVLLLPALWRRRPGRALAACLAVVAAGYALYAREGWTVLGSLGRYIAEEQYHPGALRLLLDWALGGLGPAGGRAARLLPLAALGVAAAAVGWLGRARPREERALWLAGGYLVAVPNLFPWYAVWLVPWLALRPAWPWLGFTLAAALPYLSFGEPGWRVPPWVTAAELTPLVAGLLWTARGRLRARAGGVTPPLSPASETAS